MATTEQIARVCHETNRGWCEANGDFSQKSWDEADQWQRESAIEGVQVALDGATPEQQHEAWAKSKRDAGWTYGEVKNPDLMVHPCLVPYDELPAEQQVKDALYVAVVTTLGRKA